MSKRNKIIIAVAVALGILAIVLIVLSLGERESEGNDNTNQLGPSRVGQLPLINLNANVSLPKNLQESKEQSSLLATALTFAEKFGSFSNQSGFENLDDLRVMMTPKMQSWTDRYINESLQRQGETTYFGYTTKALSANIIAQTDVLAEVVVVTQRSERQGANPQPRVFYQSILLQFVNLDGAWKVDNAQWQ